jgi:SAM-dependent methyltransferase
MNPSEYDRMASLEATHWWYRGTRDLFARLLRSPEFQLPGGAAVLDVGCGTGANLQLLRDVLDPAWLGGFDISPAAVDYARGKNPGATIEQADLCQTSLDCPPLDLVLCSDVLYTTPLEAGIQGLGRMCERLKPGGLLLLHLPAFNWLKSRHDLAVHTRQRFTKKAARSVVETIGLRVELLTYRLCLLFPAVVVARLPTLIVRSDTPQDEATSDLAPLPALVNDVLGSVVRFENRLIAGGLSLPWGSSLVAVGRKP